METAACCVRDVASAGIQRWQMAANSRYAVVKALMHNKETPSREARRVRA